jgi:hydroxyacylglutathione hydrolase
MMLLKRFYDAKLAQASFLVGSQVTGDAIVVDANRDIEQYIDAAREEGVRITHVTETHIHADFVSGSRELAERTGATLLLSDEGGDDWRYAFADAAHATLLHDGDVINVGTIRLGVMHTPGHTPEHLVFTITDTTTTDQPMGVLTGDFIFAGDVGRPDLLERAAKIAGTMEAGAHTLFRSLQRFKKLPDYLQLWPGHGAGSACGKSLGAVPSTTLGYEKMANWGVASDNESEFVQQVLAGQPEPPKYFAQMKRINREGPASLGGFAAPMQVSASRLSDLLQSGALVVDTRKAIAFAGRHVPGTLNIPRNKSFTNWAGALVPFGHPFYLIIDGDNEAAAAAAKDLAMIGLDDVAGWFGVDAIDAWERAGGQLNSTMQLGVHELDRARSAPVAPVILDVRGRSEWDAGHLPGVRHIPLAELPDRIGELPPDAPIVVHCQGGGRSAIAASLLKAHGIGDVSNLTGGYGEWLREGVTTEK